MDHANTFPSLRSGVSTILAIHYTGLNIIDLTLALKHQTDCRIQTTVNEQMIASLLFLKSIMLTTIQKSQSSLPTDVEQ